MSDTLAFSAHPAKLPEIATEDLKAIRGFLPGKLLGRTAALLSLALSLTLAYLEYFGPIHGVTAVGEKLGLTSHSWYQDGVVFGLPFLTVAAQSFNEWRAESAERTLKTLATRDGAEQSGYFRIGPYLDTADDQKKFDRADRAHVRVLDWIERSANVPLYLTGDFGSGKTSLLNAFVLPTLRERGWTVIEARVGGILEAALRSALAEGSGTRRSRLAGGNLCDMIQTAARRAPAGLLLVLDQFEEFVILGKPEQQRDRAALVADLSRSQIKGLGLLVVLRSGLIKPFWKISAYRSHEMATICTRVARFTLAAASGFMNRSGLDLQANDLDRLLSTAAELDETPGLVRPITLNVVGYVLAANHGTALSLDAGQLVRRYIEQTVGQPAIRDFAPRILECLITEQGTKQPRSERELVTATGMRRGEVRAVLNGLGSAALARPLDPAQGVWELSHDFIARAVARYLGRRRRNVLRHGAFYAAPVILAITLTGAVSATGLQRWDQTQISSELTGLGLSVMPKGEQLEVEANHLLTPESFAKTAVALSKLSSRIYRVVIKATEWGPELKPIDISNLAPLSGLVALERLELSGPGLKTSPR